MFGAFNIKMTDIQSLYYLRSYGLILVLAIIGCTPLPGRLVERVRRNQICKVIADVAEPIVYTMLLLVVTAYLVDSSFNPFLYFRF